MDKKRKPTGKKRRFNPTFEDDDFLFDEEVTPKKGQKILGIKSEYAVFYIATLVVAIIVAGILFTVLYLQIRDPAPVADRGHVPPLPSLTAGTEDESSQEDATDLLNLRNITALISNINSAERTFYVHDVNARTTLDFNVEGNTELRNRLGSPLVFADFAIGDIVNIAYDPEDNNRLVTVAISNTEAWERRFVTGLNINANAGLIVLEDETFTFTPNMQVFNNGQSYGIGSINMASVVSLRGVDNNVWVINIERGVGNVHIINGGGILNGSIEISRTTVLPIGGATPEHEVQISEGVHRVVVRGDNITVDIKEIEVIYGQTAVIDLSTIELTAGFLEINVEPIGASVTINGRTIDNINEPLLLNFNTYVIIARHDGYYPREISFEFNETGQEVEIILEEIIIIEETYVEIRTIPAGANIFVDGVYSATSPATIAMEHGPREISLNLPGFITTVDTIVVGPTPMLPFEYELQPLVPEPPISDWSPPPAPPHPSPGQGTPPLDGQYYTVPDGPLPPSDLPPNNPGHEFVVPPTIIEPEQIPPVIDNY